MEKISVYDDWGDEVGQAEIDMYGYPRISEMWRLATDEFGCFCGRVLYFWHQLDGWVGSLNGIEVLLDYEDVPQNLIGPRE